MKYSAQSCKTNILHQIQRDVSQKNLLSGFSGIVNNCKRFFLKTSVKWGNDEKTPLMVILAQNKNKNSIFKLLT